MKSALCLLVSALLLSASPARGAEPASDQPFAQQLKQIDFQIMLENYKQVRMEQFKTRLERRLLGSAPNMNDHEREMEAARLEKRRMVLDQIVDELRKQISEMVKDFNPSPN